MKRVITHQRSLLTLFPEIFKKKELLFLLAKRDIYLRYKYKTLGILWGLAQPFLLALIISESLGRIAPVQLHGSHYFLSVFIGYTFWMYFSSTIGKASTSLYMNRTLIQNSAFPHLILPLSSLCVGFIDLLISLCVALLIGLFIGLHISFFPIFLICIGIMLLTTIGIGTLFSGLFVRFADIREIMSFSITILFYLTPVIYPVRLIPQNYQIYLYLNPMTGVIETTKAVFLNPTIINWDGLLLSGISSIIIFCVGIIIFQKTDEVISDIV